MRNWRFWVLAQVLAVSSLSACGMSDLDGAQGVGGAGGAGGLRDFGASPQENGRNARKEASSSLDPALALPGAPGATSCTSNGQCASGFCVDGYCCDSVCNNTCMACSAAKKGSGVDGVCGSIAYDTDPDNECANGSCGGSNTCQFYNGVACSSTAQCLSNYCVDGVCCGNFCMDSCQACSAAKKGSGINGVCGNITASTDPDNECNPGECNGSGACNASPQPKAANGTACASGAQCQSGSCADGVCCDSWCLGTCQACTAAKKGSGTNGTCGPIANDKDPDEECWGGACNGQNACKRYNGVLCSDKSQCLSNYCIDGTCCNGPCSQLCQACSAAKKGQGNDGVCGSIVSGNDPDNECKPGECNGSGACNQTQTKEVNGVSCSHNAQCISGNCVDGVCCGNICTGACSACSAAKKGQGFDGSCGPIVNGNDPDNECTPGECNGSAACTQPQSGQPAGSACTQATQCSSGFCVDGYCCDKACGGTCEACSTAKKGSGANGTCGPIAYDNDPDNECAAGACSGASTCQSYNGVACATTATCLSNNCVDGVCCGNACTGRCTACTAAKKGNGYDGVCGVIPAGADPDNECALACSGSAICEPAGIGLTCGSDAECVSGHCADGICCDTACTGTCQACSAAKKGNGNDGTCGPIAANTDPDNECAVNCNGSSACGLAGNGATCTTSASCQSGFCVDGVCCDNACSGACVACNMPGTAGTCKSSCTPQCGGAVALGEPPVGPLGIVNATSKSIAVPDLNNDGIRDIVVTNGDGLRTFFRQSNGSLTPGSDYVTGSSPHTIASADLNGDNKADLVVSNRSSNTVSVYMNQGNGTLAPKVDYSNASLPEKIILEDFNGDNLPDMFVGGTRLGIQVRLNLGNGTFGPLKNAGTQSFATGIAVADFNGDGRKDFAAVGYEWMTVALGNGDGTFTTKFQYKFASWVSGAALVASDLNGDGMADLALVFAGSTGVAVYMGQGDGTFAAAVSYNFPCLSGGSEFLVTADFNGDSLPDLAAGNTQSAVSVMFNQGNGTLAAGGCYATGGGTLSTVTADMNGDGSPDLAVAGDNSFNVIYNQGNGQFHQPGSFPTYATGVSPQRIMTADLNGDGNADVVTSNGNNSVSILLGQGNGTFAPKVDYSTGSVFALADTNADGRPDLVDCGSGGLGISLNQGNGTFGPRAASFSNCGHSNTINDFNGDGFADFAFATYTASVDTPNTPKKPSVTMLYIRHNQGNGTFNYASSINLGGIEISEYPPVHPLSLTSRDLFADGTSDIVYANLETDKVDIFMNNTGLTRKLSSPGYAALADYTGDGKPDIGAVGVYYYRSMNVLTSPAFAASGPTLTIPVYATTEGDIDGDGIMDLVIPTEHSVWVPSALQSNGVFAHHTYYALDVLPSATVIADFNNDNRPDVAALVPANNSVMVLLNNCLP